ncbi:unnamed protein product [Didymodactylos carnosus]|uniref:Fe2OG dioxygenase domain-containing protein n=1 Tax=Didymodactylos carnosus TaxID=1234261 RepID=A0A815D1E9_9BILA|nr:unnamed protein product [Didymodactylos carnosus]CAF1488912.1 unnamed protein product [Didymodactylos carnosus]CAF4089922.1 unnamed protein product [Didymodactylos carnosus]CAF4278329.1 unnamed protein product [Didymodactylos carnosus]
MTVPFPDFPESVPTAPLVVIDYNLLVQKDPEELNRLFKASTDLGFFYLKVGAQLDPIPIFTLAESVFGQSLDTKMKYAMDGKNGVYFGYKAVGSTYTDKKGTPDMIEFWNIAKDEILMQDATDHPKPILDAKEVLKQFIIKSHDIVLVILEILSTKLGLDPHALPDLHRLTHPSGDQLRLTKSIICPFQQQLSPHVALGAHTDFGSVTILFNRLGGLQVLKPDGEWTYVRPLPDHAIVNLGDAMVKLSNGLLKSNIHRVVAPPWLSVEDEVVDRFSVVYFSRPENDVHMTSLLGHGEQEQDADHVLTAQEWIARRVKNFQTANYKDETSYEMRKGTEGNRDDGVYV